MPSTSRSEHLERKVLCGDVLFGEMSGVGTSSLGGVFWDGLGADPDGAWEGLRPTHSIRPAIMVFSVGWYLEKQH